MITKVCFFLCIFFSAFSIFPDTYSVYDMELVKQYNMGPASDEFLTDYSYDYPNGPTGLGFNECGVLYISDPIKKRLVELNEFFEYAIEHKDLFSDFALNLRIQDGRIYYQADLYLSCDEDFNRNFLIDFKGNRPSALIPHKQVDLLHSKDIVIISSGEGELYSILNPGPDPAANNRNILNTEQTLALFEEPLKYGLEGVTIDEKYRLFMNGELQTRDYRTFIEYFMEQSASEDMKDFRNLSGHKFKPVHKDSSVYMNWIGEDYNKNVYWNTSVTNQIFVFDSEGVVLDSFKYSYEHSKTSPAVHPNGDVYFLDYDKDNVYLRRIRNVWDPIDWEAPGTDTEKQYGVLNDSRVRVRDFPNTEGKHLGYLDIEQRVEIIGRTATEMKIGNMNSVWYKVRTEAGLEGWAYGYFIDVEE